MNLEDLGRRAVACKHWLWMPGMAVLGGFAGVDRLFTDKFGMIHVPDKDAGMVPDFTDPATLGCLLHLVREAWGDEDLSADRVSRAHDKLPDVWQVYVFYESGVKDVLSGHSEVEALVAALGAAP